MSRGLAVAAAMMAAIVATMPASAAALAPLHDGPLHDGPLHDGWMSWDVPAVADAPAWCCPGPGGRSAPASACRLDGRQDGHVSSHDATTDTIRIYARFAGGKLERLRSLSATCPVRTDTEIRTLSPSEQASVEWLSAQLGTPAGSDRLRHDLLAALAVHRTSLAYDSLVRIARRSDDLDQRKNAVFWLALLRGQEGADVTRSVMFDDASPDMREHAAFAITQSKSARVAEDLTRLATTDRAGSVRARAWFWLAHTGTPQTEASINTALQTEPDRNVREQAIFALSQLPAERATGALIAVAENRTLPAEDRKRAIFWLTQTASTGALAYLDKILQAAPAR